MNRSAVTELILTSFRLNGLLLIHGDRLGAVAGLSAARWQVLGALILSKQMPTIGDVAQEMGLTRQAVQRLVKDMYKQGLVRFLPNPRHKRAYWLKATQAGEAAYRTAMEVQGPWADSLGAEHSPGDLKKVIQIMRKMIRQLEDQK